MNVQDIIDYENGDMDWDRIVDMFQKLIDNGQAWTLQGSYGRMAKSLIDNGDCVAKQYKKKEESRHWWNDSQ